MIAAHILSLAIADDPVVVADPRVIQLYPSAALPAQFVFHWARCGEDVASLHIPTDEGLLQTIRLVYTESIVDLLPLVVLVAKRESRITPAEERLKALAEEALSDCCEHSTGVAWGPHRVREGGKTRLVYGYHESQTDHQVAKPKLRVFPFQKANRALFGWSRDPGEEALQETAEAFARRPLADQPHTWRITSFGLWASRAPEVRKLLPKSCQHDQTFGYGQCA